MRLLILIFAVLSTNVNASFTMNNTESIHNKVESLEPEINPTKLLLRRKRFLVFPDGSSFQLVFCTQNHGYLQIGNIVWFGNTVALAWELPTDPQVFGLFKDPKRFYQNRKVDSLNNILFVDQNGMVVGEKPYRRNPIVNPAFAKRSINENSPEEITAKKNLPIREIHEKEMNTNHMKDLDQTRLEFHRDTRIDFYGKVEKLLDGLGWNGQQCVLRLLCETGKARNTQGTLLEEILRVTFTLPGGRQFDSVHGYDIAHGIGGDCAQYSDCGNISLM